MSAMTTENLDIENFPPALVENARQLKADQQKPLPQASWEENDYVVNVDDR
jgi:hypothetical protein